MIPVPFNSESEATLYSNIFKKIGNQIVASYRYHRYPHLFLFVQREGSRKARNK